jgi:uncharacterized protein
MTTSPPRIVGFDLARGLAIFGMLVVNFHILLHPLPVGPRFLLWFKDVLCGRAAALFVILAGAGLSLLSARARAPDAPPDARRRLHRGLVRRSLFLLATGGALSCVWQLDILHYYSVFFALGLVFYRRSNRGLWALMGGSAALSAAILLEAGSAAPTGYFHRVFPNGQLAVDLLDRLCFSGVFPLFPWIVFFLFGIWLGRLDLRESSVRRRLIAGGLALLGSTALYAHLAQEVIEPWTANLPDGLRFVLLSNEAFPLSPLFLLQAAALSAVLIAACVACGLHTRWSLWCAPVAAAGQLSLTIYVGHVLVGLALARQLQKLGTPFTAPVAIGAALGAFLCCALLALGWRRHLNHGPLESAMRRFAQS